MAKRKRTVARTIGKKKLHGPMLGVTRKMPMPQGVMYSPPGAGGY